MATTQLEPSPGGPLNDRLGPQYVANQDDTVAECGTTVSMRGSVRSLGRRRSVSPTATAPDVAQDGEGTLEARLSTILHIYHTGKREDYGNFSLHSSPDKTVICPQTEDPTAPDYVDGPKRGPSRVDSFIRAIRLVGVKSATSESQVQGPRRMRKCKVIDRPTFDKRNESSPYFLHRPYISFRNPPMTLRRGGCKTAPAVCLIKDTRFWHTWTIQLADELSQDGVIDPRGVVSLDHGTEKGHGGTLKGYKVRGWRLCCETGKAYHRAENARRKALRKSPKPEPDLATGDTVPAIAVVNGESGNTASTPPSGSRRTSTSQINPTQSSIDVSNPIVPEETVHLRWMSPLSRKTRSYRFTYQSIEFTWKGTRTAKDPTRNKHWHCIWFNHLKLTAQIRPSMLKPDTPADELPEPIEFCLARFTSLLAKRKAGRLEICEEELDRLLTHCRSPKQMQGTADDSTTPDLRLNSDGSLDGSGSGTDEEEENDAQSKLRDRLHVLITATAMCMIIGEWQKRKWVKRVAQLIMEAGSGGGG